MPRGGKRANAGRKPGALTIRTRKVANQIAQQASAPAAKAQADGATDIVSIMLSNARHFYQQALDAEATLAALTPQELGLDTLKPADQFKRMKAEVMRVAGFRQLAQESAEGVAPYLLPRIAPVAAGKAKPGDEEVPLAERLQSYARGDAIAGSAGKVVELKKKARK